MAWAPALGSEPGPWDLGPEGQSPGGPGPLESRSRSQSMGPEIWVRAQGLGPALRPTAYSYATANMLILALLLIHLLLLIALAMNRLDISDKIIKGGNTSVGVQ